MSDVREFAIETAKKSGSIILKGFGEIQSVTQKSKTNFKTEVDDASDRLIRSAIAQEFPSHNIYSEETDNKTTGSRFTWVIDPLDGTIPYTSGTSDHFAVSISLVEDDKPILGVIYAPKREELYVAEDGKGAYLNDQIINSSNVVDLNKVLLISDYGKTDRAVSLNAYNKFLSPSGVRYLATYGCASVSLALVAAGKADAYFSYNLDPWDMAAAVVVCREAGAKVTNILGEEWKLGDTSIICSNQTLHKTLLNTISS